MAAELFNSLAGYSVGIPPVPVVDANGNVTTNVLTTGNVSANVVYSSYYRWANGQPFGGSAGGSNQQLQYNHNGVFAGIPNVTFDGSILSLGDISTLQIGGGVDGYFLQTDGAGNLTWSAAGGGGGNGSPGGSNTQVQFNNAGTFGGDSGFTYNNITNTLHVENANVDVLTPGFSNLGDVGNISITGGYANYVLTTDGTGNLSWTAGGGGGGNGTPGGANTYVQFNSNGVFGGTANFTFNATSNTLNVTNANISNVLRVLGNVQVSDDINASNITLSRNITTSNGYINGNLVINPTGNLRAYGNINTAGSSNINFGTLSNIHIDGGSDGYVLQTDGLGNLSWTAQSGGGGNGSPGGSNTQIQFNDSGTFGASPYLTFNNSTNTLNVAGNLIANTIEIGSGAYKFSRSNVYFATSATTSNTTLLSFPASTISGLDFVIVATDATAGRRQISKLTAIFYDATVNYSEFSTLIINGPVGNFAVSYQPGNIIANAQAILSVIPESSNMTVYKVQITAYEE